MNTSPTTAVAGAGTNEPTVAPTKLVVYSARKEELMMPLIEAFEQQSGIDVTLVTGTPGELQLKIQTEKGRSQADAFFTTDAGGAESLRQQGLLEPYISPGAASVPAEFKSADGAWTGVIGRARTIMYNTKLVKPDELPDSVFDLADRKYSGRVAMASIREGSVKLWLASLILEQGEDFTVRYIDSLLINGMRVLSDHTAVRKAVGNGQVALGLVNHYYYVFEKKDGSPVGLIYPDQGPDQMGTLVVPLAVSVLKGATNQVAAQRFVDFVLSAEGQAVLTTQENEFPLQPGTDLGAAKVEGVRPIDEIKRPTTDFKQLSELEDRVVELFADKLAGGQ